MLYGIRFKRRFSDDPALSATMLFWVVFCILVAYVKPAQELILAWFPNFVGLDSERGVPEGVAPASIMMQESLRKLNIAALPFFVIIFCFTGGFGTYEKIKRGAKAIAIITSLATLFFFSLLFLEIFSSDKDGGALVWLAKTRPGAGFFFAVQSFGVSYLVAYLLRSVRDALLR